MWSPGEHLVIDWGQVGRVHVFCAVLAWSRWRFVRFAADEKAVTTLGLLAECFAELGGVPKVVLADRMGCLKGGVVANRVVPTADYVRFAAHYRFRPDFCEAADPASKGIVENLVGYGKDDLLRPLLLEQDGPAGLLADLAGANQAAAAWGEQVNTTVHSQIAAVPAERLGAERELLTPPPSLALRIGPPPVLRTVDRLACVRIGSARYSVPIALIGTRLVVEVSGARVLIADPASGVVHAEHPWSPLGRPRSRMSITAAPGPPHVGPCDRKPLPRNSSARLVRPPRRSSPVPPRPGTPGWGQS